MGNVKFTSHTRQISKPRSEVYSFLSDLNHFEVMMPEQVIEWKSDPDACSFTIKGIGTIALRIRQRIQDSLIIVQSEEPTPISFDLRCLLEPVDRAQTNVILELEAELSPMLRIMAANPLQNLVNIMVDKLAEYFESADRDLS